MMNIFKVNKIINLILIFVVIYAIFTFINQQSKLNVYNQDISYYSSQIEDLKDKQEELLATQENVNSPEYIEKVAREKLDMYLPNETVYVDSNK
ncbi:MAG TPA: septum formation initiator family protein [Candidatus Scatovivens faecipullorum]|nr:septum formation initiator family protein [Candidatus Scatovivens faecipullorum]